MYVYFQKLSRALKKKNIQIHKLSRISRTRGNLIKLLPGKMVSGYELPFLYTENINAGYYY